MSRPQASNGFPRESRACTSVTGFQVSYGFPRQLRVSYGFPRDSLAGPTRARLARWPHPSAPPPKSDRLPSGAERQVGEGILPVGDTGRPASPRLLRTGRRGRACPVAAPSRARPRASPKEPLFAGAVWVPHPPSRLPYARVSRLALLINKIDSL